MQALSSNRYTVSGNGSLEFKATSRRATHQAHSRVASSEIALSVYEIEARWREPYERPHAFTRAA